MYLFGECSREVFQGDFLCCALGLHPKISLLSSVTKYYEEVGKVLIGRLIANCRPQSQAVNNNQNVHLPVSAPVSTTVSAQVPLPVHKHVSAQVTLPVHEPDSAPDPLPVHKTVSAHVTLPVHEPDSDPNHLPVSAPVRLPVSAQVPFPVPGPVSAPVHNESTYQIYCQCPSVSLSPPIYALFQNCVHVACGKCVLHWRKEDWRLSCGNQDCSTSSSRFFFWPVLTISTNDKQEIMQLQEKQLFEDDYILILDN